MSHDYNEPPAIRRSAALHQRVLDFARSSGKVVPPPDADTFESLALDIARFQFDYSAGFARLVARGSGKIEALDDIPRVTTDAFRMGRVAVHPPELDAARFVTSGTTSDSGVHPVRDLSTKEALTLLQAQKTLFEHHRRGIVVALAPAPSTPPTSSLGHMMELFMREFDGRPLSTDPRGATFDVHAPGRWLSHPWGIDVEGLERAIRLAIHRSEPLFILSTSFALWGALDALDGARVRAPERTTVMLTGGFKGRVASVSEEELRRRTCHALGLREAQIIGEYGMTELGSQLFEGPEPGVYHAPPWLRVSAVDPVTHAPVASGEIGLAHFLDLVNVDSSVSVLTQDLVSVTGAGVRLHGRKPGAIPRGCSLPFEGLLGLQP